MKKEGFFKKCSDIPDQDSKKLSVYTQMLQISDKQLLLTTIRDESQQVEIKKEKTLSHLKTIAFA